MVKVESSEVESIDRCLLPELQGFWTGVVPLLLPPRVKSLGLILDAFLSTEAQVTVTANVSLLSFKADQAIDSLLPSLDLATVILEMVIMLTSGEGGPGKQQPCR